MASSVLRPRRTWEIDHMRRAGQITAQILHGLTERVEPGWTTADIEAWVSAELSRFGAKSAFKGYYGFPACTCICINHEVVHGLPRSDRRIEPGDLVKVDLGAVVAGWHSDGSITLGMEPLSDADRQLIETAQRALEQGVSQVRAGVLLQQISAAIEQYVRGQGYSVSRRYMGHGIGLHLHELPPVPNYVAAHLPNPVLEAGMTLTIEPIVLRGTDHTRVLPDRWTVVTQDGQRVAQWEHTILVTGQGCEILTSLP